MRLIDADVFRLRLASIAKAFARTDAQRSLMGRCIYCLDKTTTVAEWVNVKDRMPKDGIFVLVCNDDGHMMIAKWESEAVRWEYKYMNYDWDVWDEEEQGPICYWMPLPEPPKEDEYD